MSWLIAVDPGRTCGWFQLKWSDAGTPTARFYHYELPWEAALDKLWGYGSGGGVHAVVCEKLVTSSRTTTAGSSSLWVPEFVGAARWMARRWDCEFDAYMASASKAFATNARLQALGLDPRPVGKGHARDATRLAVLWLAERGLLSLPK